MKNLALICVLAGAALLSANLYVHSEDMDSVDGIFCFDLRGERPELLLVKKYNDLKVRTVKDTEEPILCESTNLRYGESDYIGYGASAKIDFIDKSGKSVAVLKAMYGMSSGRIGMGSIMNFYNTPRRSFYPLRSEVQAALPGSLTVWNFNISQKEKDGFYKWLSQFKDTIIDGDMGISISCEPQKLSYEIKFRARIIGECDCDFFNERERHPFAAVEKADSIQSIKSGATTVTLSRDGTLTVSGKGAMRDYDSNSNSRDFPPWYNVSKSITRLVIEKGVTYIGKEAFRYCSRLTSATIPSSVTSIAKGAFEQCHSLTSITLPNSVTSIEEGAFAECYRLNSVTLPNSVTSIGKDAFTNCGDLKSITIPNSVKSIGERAFSECSNLNSITIPNSVASIGEEAFAKCYRLNSVTIGNGVTSIGKEAFYYCDSLKSITLPNSVTSIGGGAFIGCYRLTSIETAADNAHYSSVDGILFNKDKTALIHYLPGREGSYTIPDGVKSIGESAFDGCYGLTSVTFSGSVTSIGKKAFSYCRDLKSVTIPNSVKTIGNEAFRESHGLTSITIGSGVTSIGDNAFLYCSSLKSVTLHSGVKTIGMGAFLDCVKLASITLPSSVTSIGDNAFRDCYRLTSITIPNSVKTIGNDAFSRCSSLTSATIGNGVTKIGKDAFKHCRGLMSINVGKGNTEYSSADGVLFDKSQKTLLLYPSGKQGAYTIPSGVVKIAWGAFFGCYNLTSITIPGSVAEIWRYEFSDRTGLTSITVAADNAHYSSEGGVLFNKNKTALMKYPAGKQSVSYTIPGSVTSIEADAFADCAVLKSATIPQSVVSIGKDAFDKCRGLTSVIVQNPAPFKIEYSAFYGIDEDACLYVPKNSIAAYSAAETWKDFKCVKGIKSP